VLPKKSTGLAIIAARMRPTWRRAPAFHDP